MDEMLEKSIEERCDSALQKNKDYLDLQAKLANAHENNDIETFSEVTFLMQCVAMRTCYKLGISDIYNIINEP